MPKTKYTVKKIRLQFDFSTETVERIDRIQTRLDAASRSEVFRRALSLLDYATDPNKKIFIRCDDDVLRELEIL